MTDIVERLRQRVTGNMLLSMPPQEQKDGLCQEAADTIEALLAERDDYKKTAWEYYRENVALRAEIEELRKSKMGRLAWYKMRDEEERAARGESDE